MSGVSRFEMKVCGPQDEIDRLVKLIESDTETFTEGACAGEHVLDVKEETWNGFGGHRVLWITDMYRCVGQSMLHPDCRRDEVQIFGEAAFCPPFGLAECIRKKFWNCTIDIKATTVYEVYTEWSGGLNGNRWQEQCTKLCGGPDRRLVIDGRRYVPEEERCDTTSGGCDGVPLEFPTKEEEIATREFFRELAKME